MAAALVAVGPTGERGELLTVAVVDPDEPGVRVLLSPPDVDATGALVDEYGITHAATVAIADDDRTASLVADAELPEGRYLATIAVESVTLDVAGEVAASIDVSLAPFRARLEDATGFVTKSPLTASTNPSAAEARGWVRDVANRVDVRLARRADLTGAADLDAVEAAARGVIALGVAAMIVDAQHPEKATSQGERRYGDVLWQRYRQGLDDLAADLERRLAATGVVSAVGRVAASFPAPSGIGAADL